MGTSLGVLLKQEIKLNKSYLFLSSKLATKYVDGINYPDSNNWKTLKSVGVAEK